MTLTDDRQKLADTLEATREQAVWYQFFKLHPELALYQAAEKLNEQILRDYVTSGGVQVTLQTLEESLQHIADKLTISTEADARHHFIETIVQNTYKDKKSQDILRKELSSKLKVKAEYQNTQAAAAIQSVNAYQTGNLAARAEQLKARAELKGKSAEELRAIIKPGAPARPELPANYTKDVLVKMDKTAFRKLAQFYGFDLLTARLNGRG
jgi:hypothetical protein